MRMSRRFAQVVLLTLVLPHATHIQANQSLDGKTFSAVLNKLANEGLGVNEYQVGYIR